MTVNVRAGNPDIRVTFDAKKCIHARECILGLPNVFVGGVEGEWIFPENAPAEDLVAVIRRCPSGALQYERLDGVGSQFEPDPQTNMVQIRENGPLAFRGKIQNFKEKLALHRATLCRCGQSSNKPFCDGTHTSAGFTATGEVKPTLQVPEIAKEPDDLTVIAFPNGPYQVTGNHQIVTGTNAKITTQKQSHLCRCGQSSNKPFCDGTHAKVGFQAEGVSEL